MSLPTPKGWGETETETEPEPEPEPESDGGENEPTFPQDMGQVELKSAIEKYQDWCAEHYDVLEVDLDGIPVEISTQMKRTAGKVAYRKGSDDIKHIRYAFKAYQNGGWQDMAETIRHELIHVHTIQNHKVGGHGRKFKRLVEPMDTTRHCESFATDEAKYVLYCSNCDDVVAHRYQKSKTVKNPEKYNSKCCGASLRVENNQ